MNHKKGVMSSSLRCVLTKKVHTVIGSKLASKGGNSPPVVGGHSYWRVFVTSVQQGLNAAIAEVKMFNSPTGNNLCSGGTALASSVLFNDPTYNAEKAFDNNINTDWISNNFGVGQWVGYHLPVPAAITQVSLTSENGGATGGQGDFRTFKIQYSDNGITGL